MYEHAAFGAPGEDAGNADGGALVPQARVSPDPRSQTRIRTSAGDRTSTNSAFTRRGKCGSTSIARPISCTQRSLN